MTAKYRILLVSKCSLMISRGYYSIYSRGIRPGQLLSRFFLCQTASKNERSLTISNSNCVKVTVCGSSGGVGQPLSLLLKLSRLVSELSLYDVVDYNAGVATDLSHIDTPCKVTPYLGQDMLKESLKESQIVLCVAGIPRKVGMTRDDVFNTNAVAVSNIVQAIAEASPKALICIVTNPINSLVPMASEILKKAGVYDPNRLFGITTLDIIRSKAFIAKAKSLDVNSVNVPVIGGHAGITIIPLISQCKPAVKFTQDELDALILNVQEAGTVVVKDKNGHGSATLAMAYAAALFTFSLCKGITGEDNVVECSFVQSDDPDVPFFASPVLLGPNGMKKYLGMGNISDYESELVKLAIPELKKNIKKGIDYIKKENS